MVSESASETGVLDDRSADRVEAVPVVGRAGDVHARGATTAVGVVLAAGAGRRLGLPKALLRAGDGEPMLDRAVRALHVGGCEHVVVVLGCRWQDVPSVSDAHTTVVVAHDWADGMGASLRAGLEACGRLAPLAGADRSAPGLPTRAVITLVDLPDVDARLVARLLDTTDADGPLALARATFEGRPGHPVVIGREHWGAARDAARGDRGARDLFAVREHRLVECGDLATGRDVDSPADLTLLANLRAMPSDSVGAVEDSQSEHESQTVTLTVAPASAARPSRSTPTPAPQQRRDA